MLAKIIIYILRFLSRLILAKYKPKVIGITGSVGKTSAKEAIFSVVSGTWQARRNIKNYNNEIGLPLTIIGVDSPGKNIFGWLSVFFYCFYLLSHKNKKYPEFLILEMGADRPGDIRYLTDFVSLQIGVLTAIAPVHLEYFKKIENIFREKKIIVEVLPRSGWAVINGDDSLAIRSSEMTKAEVISFGLGGENNVQASEVKLSTGREDANEVKGMSFKLLHAGRSVPVFLPGVLGKHQVYAALSAAAVGVALEINLVEIAQRLKTFKSPKGRMNLVHGIKQTLIIDDTYNSSPAASQAALQVIKEIPMSKGRRIVIFGEMLELGSFTHQGHREVGFKAAELGIDLIICIGEKTRDISRGAKEAGMDQNYIYYFPNNKAASDFIKSTLAKDDLILVKGSQSARMEQVVKKIMVNPDSAAKILCRQDEPWVKG